MPTRNRIKTYVPETYYHIYNRGWNKSELFRDEEDYLYFESLFARHLGPTPSTDALGREYKWLRDAIQLNAYCLMPNHFHLLVYQYHNERAISQLMSSILTAYTMYFNRKYQRRGSLFGSKDNPWKGYFRYIIPFSIRSRAQPLSHRLRGQSSYN